MARPHSELRPTQTDAPRRDSLLKHLGIGFSLAFLLYLGGYWWIEHLREAKGPWRVSFKTDGQGQPTISISQATLGISNVTFVFPSERLSQTNIEAVVVYDAPKTNAPFGKVIFLDTTFQPGTVTYDLFGHEIELLPRTLVMNLKEIPWKSDTVFELTEKDKRKAR